MENNQQSDQSQENVKKEFKSFASSLKEFFVELLDIREGTDKQETIQKIKDSISMKGHTAWILVFSIIIASIGLNVSSTAVVIGAMLVSPLMGPILGVGLSIGINDIDTLKRSLINLGIMVGLSVVTSLLFFSIPLFQDLTPEIEARTAPDVRDVLIAIAGGLALIIALSRHKEITTVIAGIAIATALMPPLCTAGYGLAVGNLSFFGGAMFLFIINAVFIALATFVIVKFLRFPMKKYINSANRKRIAQLASFVAVIIFSFSIYQFYLLFQENNYKQNGERFINDLKSSTGAGVIDKVIDPKKKSINLVVLGKNLSQEEQNEWRGKLTLYSLEETVFTITQDDENLALIDKVKSIEDLYVKNQKLIASKEESLQEKDKKIRELGDALSSLTQKQIPFLQVSQEAKINYEGLVSLSFSNMLVTNFKKIDTIPVASITWLDSLAEEKKVDDKLALWLKTRLSLDTLVLKRD